MDPKQWESRVVEERFHLRQYLGGSPHSAVFLTESGEETPRKAAIKLVPADMGKADAWALRREFAARLSHPGLLSIFGFGTCRIDGDSVAYAVMEPGDEDLSQVIPNRPLSPVEAREMLLAVVEILAYVHAQGFVHARLTPANIMAAGDRVKISSDGLLRIGESSRDLWAPDPSDPPESLDGLTPASDVWWLGILLVEALTQRAPAWDRAGRGDPPVPQTMPAPFRDIARRALRWDPRLRCSLEEISRALQPDRPVPEARPREAAPAAAARPAAKPAAPPAARKQKYFLPVAGAVLAGVLATVGIMTISRPQGAPHTPEPQPAAPAAPAAVPAAPTPAPAPRATTATGDVVERFVPHAEYLGTIHAVVNVRVRVQVDPSGAVVNSTLDSRPSSPYFERLSVEAARRWKFKPTSGVAGSRLLRFEYRRDGCTASAD